jgi:DNA-binding NtrC family response regulator
MNKPRILIVEDDDDWQQIYKSSLSKSAYEITGTRKITEALALLQKETFDVAITDLKMLGGSEAFSGFGVLEHAKSSNPEIQVIVITGFGSADHAMRAMGSGAYDYIIKGPDLRKKLALTVKGALEINSLKQQLLREAQNDDVRLDANPIIGNSSSMRALFEQISQSSENEFNVLIQGESGTGKRLIAQTIHLRSARRNGPFLVVDCGRLSETVLEAELFGYEAGTIFSAPQGHPGKFELAQDGTIFLDGFGNLDVQLQHRLIGVICDRQVERIGGKAPIAINARIIASTDKDLKALNETGHFESKLLYALREFVITVPPLRKRKDGDDIPALAAMFLQRYSKNPQLTFSKDAIELLKNYDYPGNVRELESIVKHALSVSRGSTILPEHLRSELRGLVQLILDGQSEEFTEARKNELLMVLATLLHVDRESIKVSRVFVGSIIIELQLEISLIELLTALVVNKDPRLAQFKILGLKLSNGELINTGGLTPIDIGIPDTPRPSRTFERRSDDSQESGEIEAIYEPSVFISYAWGDEREETVNQIDESLQKCGLKIIRDKRDLGYKGSIREFMERIGKGDCVIVVISDKYLRSPNCMFELVEIAENKQFHDRVFPIVLSDANIYDPVKRIEYVKHWEAKRKELAKAMKTLDPANLHGIREDMDQYDRIRDKISGITSILKDMNTLTPEMHQDSDFSQLYDAIEKSIRSSRI